MKTIKGILAVFIILGIHSMSNGMISSSALVSKIEKGRAKTTVNSLISDAYLKVKF